MRLVLGGCVYIFSGITPNGKCGYMYGEKSVIYFYCFYSGSTIKAIKLYPNFCLRLGILGDDITLIKSNETSLGRIQCVQP